jgi:hypothetical protein
MDSYRYTKPATNRQPYKSHLYIVKAPKIGRRIRFFHKLPLQQWVLLEADPDVETYCERPIVTNHENIKNRIVDFWVKRKDQEEILFIRKPKQNKHQPDITNDPAFKAWVKDQNINIKVVTASEILAQPIYLENWQTILHFLASNMELVSNDLIEKVIDTCKANSEITLESITNCLSSQDPMLVYTAFFMLLHKGTLNSHELADTALSPSIRFAIS